MSTIMSMIDLDLANWKSPVRSFRADNPQYSPLSFSGVLHVNPPPRRNNTKSTISQSDDMKIIPVIITALLQKYRVAQNKPGCPNNDFE